MPACPETVRPATRSTQLHLSRNLVVVAVLGVMTLIAYWNVLDNGFVRYDDDHYVTANLRVQQGLSLNNVMWAFTTGRTGNWHPLTWLSHMLDVEMFGMNPSGHHAMNLAFHILNSIVLFLVLGRLTHRKWLSAFVCGFFALHPLHVESVAWISERKDLLSTFFALLAMMAYIRFTQKPSAMRYALIVFGFVMSLMAKPMYVSLPLVLLAIDYWPLGRWPATGFRRLLEKLPLLALAGVSSVITVIAQGKGGSMARIETLPLAARAANAFISYARYLGKTFWPVDLAVLYPYPLRWQVWQIVGAILLFLIISGIVIRSARRRPFLLTGWFWFVVTLVPVIGLVQVGVQSMADRYTYFPLVGIFIMAVWGTASLIKRRMHEIAASSIGFAILGVLGALTWNQTKDWRDTPTLFLSAIESTSSNEVMFDMLAQNLVQENRDQSPLNRLARAAGAREIDPRVHFNLAESFLKQGDFELAMQCYELVLLRQSDHIDAMNNLAWLLSTHADARLRDGKRAVVLAERAVALRPMDPGLLDSLAAAYAEDGRFADAIRVSEPAARLARDSGLTDMASMIDFHVAGFRAHRPIRMQDEVPMPITER
jgi:tetratricopeptide (TPR) repeat protein